MLSRFFLLTVFIATQLQIQAQPQKGSIYLGGSLYGSLTISGGRGTSLGLLPEAGIMLSDRWLVGLTGGYAFSGYNSGGSGSTILRNHTPSGGIFARRYFRLTDRFFIQLNTAVTYSETWSRYISPYYDYTIPSKGLAFQTRPGLTYFIKPNFSIFSTFGILNYQLDGLGSGTSALFQASLNSVSIGIGLQLRSGKKGEE